MPLPLAALGTVAAKGAGVAKTAFAGLNLNKLLFLLFGGEMALSGIEALGGYKTQKAQLGLGGKQIELQAALGKREEERTDKLMRRLARESEKQYLRGERSAAKKDIRAGQARQNEMAMAMLMALSNIGQQQGEIISRPRPSTSSMLSLMR